MSEPFIAQIVMFGGNFAPRSWALCDGQLLAIIQNNALFSILGTTYGGDGRTTFALPDMRGRLPMNQGNGPGLSNRLLGVRLGSEKVTLLTTQIPPHKHVLQGSTAVASTNAPVGNVTADAEQVIYSDDAPTDAMSTKAIGNAGGNQGHENIMPSAVVNFIIALTGVFPSRN